MSAELTAKTNELDATPVDNTPLDEATVAGEFDDEYEEISSDEVDRVVALLDELAETVTSENISAILSEASHCIFHLIYDEDDAAQEEDSQEEDSQEDNPDTEMGEAA